MGAPHLDGAASDLPPGKAHGDPRALRVALPNPRVPDAAAGGSRAPAPARPPLRVLVAEDNPVNQLVIVRMLEKLGHESFVAENGLRVLEALAHEKYDVVLMDVQMPLMSGLEATAEIRRVERASGAHLPIIGVTAYALKGDKERCLDAGMDAYVSKPVQVSVLVAAIDELFPPAPNAAATGTGPVALASSRGALARVPKEMFDLAQATGNAGGDLQVLREVARVWLGECPRRMAEVHGSLRGRDVLALERAADRVRGALLTLGALSAARAAEQLQELAPTQDFALLAAEVSRVEAEVARVRPVFEELVKGAARAA
jgi:CheY-like chemotaxis protein